MKKSKIIIALSLMIVASTSCGDKGVTGSQNSTVATQNALTEPITETFYFRKLADDEINIEINSDEYYVRSGFYSRDDIFALGNWGGLDKKEYPRLFIQNISEKYGYLNADSEIVIEPQYEYAENFSEGVAIVRSPDEKRVFIDESGNVLEQFKEFIAWTRFTDGVGEIKDDKGEIYAVDHDGNKLYGGRSDVAKTIFLTDSEKNGHTLRRSSKEGLELGEPEYRELVDIDGNIIIEKEEKFIDFYGAGYNYVFGTKDFSNDINYVVSNDNADYIYEKYDARFAVLDISGNVVSKWLKYNYYYRLIMNRYEHDTVVSDGMILIYDTVDKKFGYMSVEGEIVIEPVYEYANPFSEGLACVSDGKMYGFINVDGEFAIPMQYEILESDYIRKIPSFREPDALIELEGMNLSAFFRNISFNDGLCSVREGDKFGFIDKSGEFVIPPQFDSTAAFWKGIATCRSGNNTYIIEHKNN